MAGLKDIKNRIVSVRNTRKITRTMEMVATAKSKRMSDRVHAARPYSLKVAEIMRTLGGLAASEESPLLRNPKQQKRAGLLVISANRGLCGGYNGSVLRLARETIQNYEKAGIEIENYVIGKKGKAFFRFMKMPMETDLPFATELDDTFQYEDAEKIAEYLMGRFSEGNLDSVEIIATVYHSSARQSAERTKIMPFQAPDLQENESASDAKPGDAKTPDTNISDASDRDVNVVAGPVAQVIFEPAPEVMLGHLLPLIVKTAIYRALLEAVTSEQIYRRVAMKNATDNAGDMIQALTMKYNRKRQASITQEISEIVAGADSVG